jgi:hypothetical protein
MIEQLNLGGFARAQRLFQIFEDVLFISRFGVNASTEL